METIGVTEERDAHPDQDFRTFFEREYPRLATALYLLTSSGAEAEDLAQEAMVRTFERWDRIRRMESPTGYLFRTALNLHRSRLRRLARAARQVLPSPPGAEPATQVEAEDQIARAMERLPVGQRQALVLVEWLGYDAQEAGRLLGIEPVSVRVRLSRARKALLHWFEEDL